jgi:hypothetical protein
LVAHCARTAPDESQRIRLNCPEFSLPLSLTPLYGQLNDWLEPTLATLTDGRRPPARFPLDGWLMADWPDGRRLILFQDGRLQASQIETGEIVSDTLAIDLATGLVEELLAADVVAPGLSTFLDETAPPPPGASRC